MLIIAALTLKLHLGKKTCYHSLWACVCVQWSYAVVSVDICSSDLCGGNLTEHFTGAVLLFISTGSRDPAQRAGGNRTDINMVLHISYLPHTPSASYTAVNSQQQLQFTSEHTQCHNHSHTQWAWFSCASMFHNPAVCLCCILFVWDKYCSTFCVLLSYLFV